MRRLLSTIPFLFLAAAPLFAQEELHGTWEGTVVVDRVGEITNRLTFEADGSFEIDQVIQVKDDFLADVEVPEAPAMETISAYGTGTYGVEGNSLMVEIAELDLKVDGEGFIEFFTRVARGLARYAADSHGVSEESYPEFEQAFVDEFFAVLDEVELLAVFGEEGGTSTYTIDGNVLTLTTEADAGVWEFERVDGAPTAVARTTWGRLKSTRSP